MKFSENSSKKNSKKYIKKWMSVEYPQGVYKYNNLCNAVNGRNNGSVDV